MTCHGSTSFTHVFIFIVAATIGCRAVILQPLTGGEGHVNSATKRRESINASKIYPRPPVYPGQSRMAPRRRFMTPKERMKHEDDRMSGRVLWRNNKNHAAGSNCLCNWAQDKHKCTRGKDDDSQCFLVCCVAGKTHDCTCGWAIATPDACKEKNKFNPCFESCCNDVAKDLQKYGAKAYPGAELLYPQRQKSAAQPVAQQQLYDAQPVQQSATEPAAQPATQPIVQPVTEQELQQSAPQATMEHAAQSVVQPAVQATVDPATQSIVQPAMQPAAEQKLQKPAMQPAMQPATEQQLQQNATQATMESAAESAAQPSADSVVQAAVEHTAEVAVQPVTQAEVQPAAQPVAEAAVQPLAQAGVDFGANMSQGTESVMYNATATYTGTNMSQAGSGTYPAIYPGTNSIPGAETAATSHGTNMSQRAGSGTFPAAYPGTNTIPGAETTSTSSGSNMSQGAGFATYPATSPRTNTTPGAGVAAYPGTQSLANPAFSGGYPMYGLNATSQYANNGNTTAGATQNTQLVQHSRKNGRMHSHKHKHHKRKHS